MSIEAYQAAWAADCTGGIKLTLLAIAEYASKKNGYSCMASIGTLAKMTGTSTRQMKRNITTLEGLGLIKVERGQGRSYTNLYSIYALVKGDMGVTFNEEIKGDIQGKKVTWVSPIKPLKVTPRVNKGDTHVTLSVNNHKNKREEENPIQILSNHFTSIAGVFPSPSNYDVNWHDPLQLYLDNAGSLEATKKAIERAVKFAKNGDGKRYTVSSPRSLATIIANMPKDGEKKIKVGAI